MIAVIRMIRTKPDKSDLFASLTAELQRNVRQHEPDVLIYQVMRGIDDPTLFAVTELFRTSDARAAHADMPYHKNMTELAWSCVQGTPDIRTFTPLTDIEIDPRPSQQIP